jgi:hypothetical protein
MWPEASTRPCTPGGGPTWASSTAGVGWDALGKLSGSELVVDGTAYRAGDRIVTLAPGARGEIVTSECGTVLAVDVGRRELAAVMDDDGRIQRFAGEDLDTAHLAHGYAVTVHRSQGATVARSHVLEDGGGRELAYVKMSRARERTTVYAVADSVEQAAEDLGRSWAHSRRIGWAIDTGTPAGGGVVTDVVPKVVEASAALRHARLVAEREALRAAMPADPVLEHHQAEARVRHLQAQLRDLDRAEGWGVWRDAEVGEAARAWRQAVNDHRSSLARLEQAGFRDRRQLRRQAAQALEREPSLREDFERLAAAERTRIATELPEAEKNLADLERQRRAHDHFEHEHPEAYRRLDRLDREIAATGFELDVSREELDGIAPELPEVLHRRPTLEHDEPELDLGLDIGW